MWPNTQLQKPSDHEGTALSDFQNSCWLQCEFSLKGKPVWRGVSDSFLVQYLATQTGGATVNNSFEVRFTYTKID